jgi:hypothetical protein
MPVDPVTFEEAHAWHTGRVDGFTAGRQAIRKGAAPLNVAAAASSMKTGGWGPEMYHREGYAVGLWQAADEATRALR